MNEATISRNIVWLHLSDLHFCAEKTGWDVHRVTHPLISDLKKMEHEHGLLPQLLFFTGDAAFGNIGNDRGSTLEEQFDQVGKFIESVRTAFSTPVPLNHVFLVPGNHDVDRKLVTPALTEWLTGAREPDELTNMIKEEDGAQWKQYADRLHAYRTFLERFKYTHLLEDPKRLIYAAVREFHGRKIGIGGFNSAWSCGRDKEKGKLWLAGDWQSGEIIRQLSETDIRIALLHHPFGWFVEQEDPVLRPLFEREFQVLLHGHEHQGWVQANSDGHVRIAAAACYDRSDKENGYNFVRLNLDSYNGEIWLRRYDRIGGAWVPSIVAGRTNNDGLWPLQHLPWLTPDGGNLPPPPPLAAPPPPSRNVVLPPRPDPFIGRHNELEQVISRLQNPGCIYIWGQGGVGKTALASEATWRLNNHFRGQVVYDIPPYHSFDDILNTIARFFSQHGLIDLPLDNKLQKIRLLLHQNQPTLVYLDDLADSALVNQSYLLAPYCSLLITSRKFPLHRGLQEYELGMMDRVSSIKLFEAIYAAGSALSDPAARASNEICEIVGDLPLAIGILASNGRLYGFRIQRSLKRLKSDPLSQVKPWTASMNLLYQDLDAPEQRLFALLSLFRGNVFPLEAATAFFDDKINLNSFIRLIELLLVQPAGNDRYVLHPLIQEFATNKLQEVDDYSLALEQVIDWFLLFVENHRKKFNELSVELKNIQTVMDECYRRGDAEPFLRFTHAMLEHSQSEYAYGFLSARGFWSEAVDIVKRALELTNDPSSQAKLYEHLGLFYYWKTENDKAKDCYERALKLSDQVEDFSEKAVLLHRIGFIESDEGNYPEAERVYRQSVEIAEQHDIPNVHLATGIHLVGTILYHRCQYEDSREYLLRALEMRRESPWASSVTKRRLAGTYRKLGQLEEAEKLLKSCVDLETQRRNERNIARCLRQIGMVRQLQRNIPDARRNFNESFAIFQKIGNKKGIASILTNLGEVNLAEGNIKKAESELQESLKMAKEQRSSYGMAMNLRWLAEIAFQRGNYTLAANQAMESLSYFEAIEHVHVKDVCRLLNRALVELNPTDVLHVDFPECYGGECADKIETVFGKLWLEARDYLMKNEPSIDEKLLKLQDDDRRGISLIFRPPAETRDLLRRVSERLHRIAPDQHYYDPSEYHVTIMTLVTATKAIKREELSEEFCVEKLHKLLSHHRLFRLYFRGIGATKDSVLAHSFFRDGTLNVIRREIAEEAPGMGIGWMADPYPRTSAHVTLMRLCRRNAEQLPRLADEIGKLAQAELGVCPVDTLELVFNDWYMSKGKVELIERFSLK